MRRNIAGIVCVITGAGVLVFSLFSFDAGGGEPGVWDVFYSVAARLGLSLGACLVVSGFFLLHKTNN